MLRRRQQNPSQKRAPSGQVRIISGLWRGRKLPVHDAEGLRPTTDRVKETLFNWLAQDIPHARCLDLFAGSGGLGFESASRQADKVTMLEMNPQAFAQLKTNIAALKASNIEAVNTDTLAYLKQPGQAYDVVFIDPPFRQGLLQETVQLLEQNGWLAANAMIYIESEKELPLTELPESWQLYREKLAGQVCYRLFERTSE
ncbi:16S rRNA (guanine(966)-N(2))-methyltransferase RsmD [Vibrio fluvialis]|jgi:16S rRNA (guanine966-N2)-methyltransferase|uniref:Ribosomal RNA small subunit methyltransferase D n=3 Tax=Vibrio TaxID=662 RepID=A0AAX2LS82_VIBFL|nr:MULTISPECIES: 16S rRNA (guanine(966)-N(2))-methyltransferase RsmD [Vibrio]TNF22946.1 MAG: 16S rRNA (guanine(966)-N(2))-methyltransferase RsmD [Vibrionaceae bacterium]AMF95805.1 16S rRNA (guanine(966)-N(2))-methyltransferase RsmD [Vibrio fluvialis]EKO3382963.1 16S rRNA (guanine(966)-N(2))-methyltransferase RsmD [Vibrio fluvialis]EKO3392176.1 16S rRNA (guanine(966)-N(2))-methyltransferase RsmD [Vibrio fluvialis]EKO3400883.1 16S rRNA (guanine(966)-N(2))-methyltransferase RsmD [Vibrio fluvialis